MIDNARLDQPPTSFSRLESCATQTCTLNEIQEAESLTGGANVFVGYALSEAIDVGGRVILGPQIGPAGGGIIGAGPALTFHATSVVGIGVWGLFGTETLKGHTVTQAPAGYRISGSGMPFAVGETTGLGIGLELSVRLFEIGRGAVVANTTPFVLAGSTGTALGVPVGIAYRFQ